MDRTNAPPYARIAAELRRRIENGELAPGDRVPSTREITRAWGVAMATASKALLALRQQGLVRAVPGVGTVVQAGRPAEGSSPGSAPTVTRRRTGAGPTVTRRAGAAPNHIVAAAVAVADTEGLAALSMRRVATEIGVSTMSLYRHVADKDDLLLQMMDATLGEWPFPTEPPDGWRSRLELAARMLWATFRRHPWLAPAVSVNRPQPVPNALPYIEWVLTALDGHGLTLADMLTTHITMFNYVRGTAVNIELEAEAEATSGMNSEEWLDSQESVLRSILDAGHFPLFERLEATDYTLDLDELFEFGLQRLLDGLMVLLDGR